jgi:hypothetical protein
MQGPMPRQCSLGICVGDPVVELQDCVEARVLGIGPDTTFAVQETASGRISSGWNRSMIAAGVGCGRDYCAGQLVYPRGAWSHLARIAGVEWTWFDSDAGSYALRFEDTGELSCHWSSGDLVGAGQLPNPVPTPVPALSWECRLTTPTSPNPGYVGRGPTQEQALATAIRACLGFETPYQCRKNGRMKCGST